jgi:2,3-bisphosphoglycerate-dependent phosphoglycerate mutase
MERLILARHGESTYSARGLVNGDPAAAVGLTARGEEEARALGRALADEPLELCVVTALPRTRATAEAALGSRAVPIEEVSGLGDPRAGSFEGLGLEAYRAWAWSSGSRAEAPGGGESRLDVIGRYVLAYRRLLERSEGTILAVVHALPIAYVLLALDGAPPAPRVDLRIEHAQPFPVTDEGLRRALDVLEAWHAEPTW